MATKYDYSNIEFAKRIKLRRDIMTLNRVIAGIKYSIGYPANVFIYISEKYYNKPRTEIVKEYPVGANPIDYLNSKALYQYREYLNDIVLHWEKTKLSLNKFNPSDFSVSIEKCADIARERARALNALPHNNIASSKLPKNITGAMIKKVDHTLKKANISDVDFNDSITSTRRTKNKPRKEKEPSLTKSDVKQAVKEAIEELGDEQTKSKEIKQDVNLFNYDEVYNKKYKLTNKEKIEMLEKDIAKTKTFWKKIKTLNESGYSNHALDEQLRAQDYYDAHFKTDMQELKRKEKELKKLVGAEKINSEGKTR